MFRRRYIALVSIAAAIAVGLWLQRTYSTHGQLSVVVCDVGQGDGILLRTPDGVDVLVDGGPPGGTDILGCLGSWLPPWDREVELVVSTHADADHLGGLPDVAARYRVAAAVGSGVPAETAAYRRWVEALQRQVVEFRAVRAGDRIRLGREVVAEVVAPLPGASTSSRNEAGVVLRIVYGQTAMLLTGDAGLEAEAALVASGQNLGAQLLKVGHHGSRGSSGSAFLAAVQPEAALISVGLKNRYGHPHAEALARLAAAKVVAWRTDEAGDLVWRSNGSAWRRVRPARP